MSSMGLSIMLANSIIGVGILAMPYCFQQCGVLLATLILLLMGLLSRLSCYFLLKSAIISRRRNFEFLAFHVFGYPGKIAVEMGIIGFLMGTCIAYFVVVGDLGPQIISKVFNINQSDVLRTSIMIIVSLVCVLPLGLLRNVDSLSNMSAATIAFYFSLVIKLIVEAMSRLVSEGSPGRIELWRPDGLFQCIPIFSMALFCQTQLFELFDGLPPLTLEKMNVVTKNAINICAGVYFTLGLFGYIAFSSQNISGNVLSSLGDAWGSDVIRLGFVMSLAFSFPLVIFPCRASLYSFMYRKVHLMHQEHIINHSIPTSTFRLMTISIIGTTLFISLMIPNIELVLGLLGSTIGVLICVVFPAACFVNVTYKDTNERILAKAILVLGLLIMVLGTLANLEAAENKNEILPVEHQMDRMMEDFLESKKETFDKLNPIVVSNKTESKLVLKNDNLQSHNPVSPKPINKAYSKNKAKLETVKSKDGKDIQITINTNNNFSVNDAIMKQTLESKDKKIPEVNDKVLLNQNKINMEKEQELIETIKQHGKEQKELLEEQKEILSEIMKRKQETKIKNKEENDEDQAKKIAVESIKKIANIAIDSLSAKSEKTNNNIGELIENVAIQAKEEIAQKADETLKLLKRNIEKLKPENRIAVIKEEDKNNVNHNVSKSNINTEPKYIPKSIIKKDNIKVSKDVNLDSIEYNNIKKSIVKNIDNSLPQQPNPDTNVKPVFNNRDDKVNINKFVSIANQNNTITKQIILQPAINNQLYEQGKHIKDNKTVLNPIPPIPVALMNEARYKSAKKESNIYDSAKRDQHVDMLSINDEKEKIVLNEEEHESHRNKREISDDFKSLEFGKSPDQMYTGIVQDNSLAMVGIETAKFMPHMRSLKSYAENKNKR